MRCKIEQKGWLDLIDGSTPIPAQDLNSNGTNTPHSRPEAEDASDFAANRPVQLRYVNMSKKRYVFESRFLGIEGFNIPGGEDENPHLSNDEYLGIPDYMQNYLKAELPLMAEQGAIVTPTKGTPVDGTPVKGTPTKVTPIKGQDGDETGQHGGGGDLNGTGY
ncbi:uncharacterized protein DFL_007145 [Arthrobotrys flagrans]|uniref:Uncharacterized protein n=1 Tax=Arthrobotrys flagrans TaxID=97331 RepID=A0A436ZUY5_ARTFL|nr:hypothetical protein DFL_007145 [Arthrobotrys flagrans]